MSEKALRLLLVDELVLMRRALAKLLDSDPQLEVVGEAGTRREGIQLHDQLQPDVTLIDLALSQECGIECLREIKRNRPDSLVLMLSSSELEYPIFQAMESGADGYITKAAAPEELIDAIRTIAGGERYMSEVASMRLKEYSNAPQLSEREIEVLRLLRHGMSNPSIGEALGIAARTAKAHVASILEKFDVRDRAEAVCRGFEKGFLS